MQGLTDILNVTRQLGDELYLARHPAISNVVGMDVSYPSDPEAEEMAESRLSALLDSEWCSVRYLARKMLARRPSVDGLERAAAVYTYELEGRLRNDADADKAERVVEDAGKLLELSNSPRSVRLLKKVYTGAYPKEIRKAAEGYLVAYFNRKLADAHEPNYLGIITGAVGGSVLPEFIFGVLSIYYPDLRDYVNPDSLRMLSIGSTVLGGIIGHVVSQRIESRDRGRIIARRRNRWLSR